MSVGEARAASREADAQYNRGIALRRGGDWRGAALAFRAAARLAPGDFDAVQNVVNTLAQAVRAGVDPFPEPGAGMPETAPGAAVSVVVCSVDAVRLERMRASFERAMRGRTSEFIVIGDARSLAAAYGAAVERCRHEIVIFSHDDVELASPGAMDAVEAALGACDIVGVAGSRRAAGPAVLWAGHPHLHGWVAYPAPGGAGWDATVFSLESGVLGGMQTLDGCLIACRRDAARRVGFDAATFDGFHFYDLDFCVRAHRAGYRLAVTTEVLAVHASRGGFGAQWQRYRARFQAKFPEMTQPAGAPHWYAAGVPDAAALRAFYATLRAIADEAAA